MTDERGKEYLTIAADLERLATRLREAAVVEGIKDENLSPGQILALARNRARLSQKDLAELADVSVNAIIKFEKGYTKPRPRTLMALAEHVGLSWETLQEDEDEPDEE